MTTVEASAHESTVLVSAGGSLVEMSTRDAFHLVTELLAAIDTARRSTESERVWNVGYGRDT